VLNCYYSWRKEVLDMQKDPFDRITINSEVMVGKPTIRGMRITVEQVLRSLAGGLSAKDLLDDYPELEEEDIRVALLYASELVGEERTYALGK
jgi:uncharacterized protein (DUF433 family)